jgi:tripartite-type tricarboxylate transporter receptor subunit TctC
MKWLMKFLATVTFLGAVTCAAWADGFPNRPVTLVVPGGPGGAVDAVARVFASQLSAQLGQPVVVDDRAGAGGNIGTALVAKSAHDGYTLLMAASSAQTINPALYAKPGFDPVADFAPISLIATAPYVLVINPKVPANSVKELVALAKAQPGSLYYGSAGNGSLNHLLAEMFKASAGIELTHVPYKAVAPAAADAVAGQVQIVFGSMPGVMPFVRGGQLRALGVATAKRTALAPDLPTIGETLPGFESTAWYGLMAPAGTPPDVIRRLQEATIKALAGKEVAEQFAVQGLELASDNPEQFSALIRDDLARWAKVVKASGARLD